MFAESSGFSIFALPKILLNTLFSGIDKLEKNFNSMANHKSSLQRIRNSESKRVRNRYQAKTLRNAIKNFREVTDKKEAAGKLPKLASMLDRLAKTNVIHKNKASNLKSELAVHINHLK